MAIKLSKLKEFLANFKDQNEAIRAIIVAKPSAYLAWAKFYAEKPLTERKQYEIEVILAVMLGHNIIENDCNDGAEIFEGITGIPQL